MKIVIVNDDESVARALSEYVSMILQDADLSGVEIELAHTLTAARAVIDEHVTDVALILVDGNIDLVYHDGVLNTKQTLQLTVDFITWLRRLPYSGSIWAASTTHNTELMATRECAQAINASDLNAFERMLREFAAAHQP